MLRFGFLLWLVLFSFLSSAAAPLNSLSPSETSQDLVFEYLRDPDGVVDLQRAVAGDGDWIKLAEGGINLGFTEDQLWARFSITNPTQRDEVYLLEVGYPPLDYVTFYQINTPYRENTTHEADTTHQISTGGERVERVLVSGDQKPFYPRDIDHPSYIFRTLVAPGETQTFYLQTQTEGSLLYPLKIWHEKDFFQASAKELKVQFFYYGALWVMILLNLAIFFTLRELTYLWYALATTGYFLFFATIRGFAFQHLWPAFPELQNTLMLLSMPMLATFSLLFARWFINTPRLMPRLDKAIVVMAVIEGINMILAFLLPYNFLVRWYALLALPLWIILFLAGPLGWRAGSRSAMYFTYAWSLLTTGFVITMCHKFGFIGNSFLAEYGMQIGSGIEAAILTFALAERVYQEREQKISAQDRLLREGRQRREAQKRTIELAMHDRVTGLPNRTLFELSLKEAIQSQPQRRLYVSLIFFKNLREVNKTLGSQHGDAVSENVARQVEKALAHLPGVLSIEETASRKYRLVSLHEDTLAFISDAQKAEENEQAYSDFRVKIVEPFKFDEMRLDLLTLFGISRYPADSSDVQELIRHARVALEFARHRESQWAYYVKQQDPYDEKRLTLLGDLRQSLLENQPELYYQPKLMAATGKVVGVEALIRWNHPTRGFVAPTEFIPLAEETGLIREVTRWVMNQALQDLRKLHGYKPTLTMSINLSARNLRESSLEADILTALQSHGIAADYLIFELTETAVMNDPQKSLRRLESITQQGIKLSIDDYGAGYSSLSYLKKLPAYEIKLDRSLLTDLTNREEDRVIVQSTIAMCKNLGYRVVGEGIEDSATYDELCLMGCDMVQGYYFGRPMPLEELTIWLMNHHANKFTG